MPKSPTTQSRRRRTASSPSAKRAPKRTGKRQLSAAAQSVTESPPPVEIPGYTSIRLDDELRPNFEDLMETVRQAVGMTKSAMRASSIRKYANFVRNWQLTNADAASLLRVEEQTFASGDWKKSHTAEMMYRIVAVVTAVSCVHDCLGRPATDRWLREPDPHPDFDGVVPMQELAQEDAMQVSIYKSDLQALYPTLPGEALEEIRRRLSRK